MALYRHGVTETWRHGQGGMKERRGGKVRGEARCESCRWGHQAMARRGDTAETEKQRQLQTFPV